VLNELIHSTLIPRSWTVGRVPTLSFVWSHVELTSRYTTADIVLETDGTSPALQYKNLNNRRDCKTAPCSL